MYFQHSQEVLNCFESYKLDDLKSSQKKLEKYKSKSSQHNYFAKYLTSEKVKSYSYFLPFEQV